VHNNYYFLKRLSAQLATLLPGQKVTAIFSQEKNELVMAFVGGADTLYIKALLDPSFSCLSFPQTHHRARANSVDLFDALIGKAVVGVRQFLNERAFAIEFTDQHHLLFKMYGNLSNIILMVNGESRVLFKKNLKRDMALNLESLDRPLPLHFEAFREAEGRYEHVVPTLGKAFRPYFDSRRFDEQNLEQRWAMLQSLLKQLQEGKTQYLSTRNQLPALLLYEPTEFYFSTDNPMEALNRFFSEYIAAFALHQQKTALTKALNIRIQKADNYVESSEARLQMLRNAHSYAAIADLIMANLHAIPAGSELAVLNDFYTGEPLRIKLKPTLSPQKNAEQYYRKAKNQNIEISTLSDNIARRRRESEEAKALLSKLEAATNVRELKKYAKDDPAEDSAVKGKTNDGFTPIHCMGYDILVGKNDKKNDLLTFRIASKDDLWLHAKDAAGAHVIVRQKPGSNFPQMVIERAAQLAAYHSRRKTESLCPVSYTLRKYVRKRKGAPAGQVVVEKEKTILVEPRA
jgi:predicted ribosome quality control (RQC) complex YloA/Tae2 family protein